MAAEFDVKCEYCGSDLDCEFLRNSNGYGMHLAVKRCEKCEEQIKKEGMEEGKREAEDARDES